MVIFIIGREPKNLFTKQFEKADFRDLRRILENRFLATFAPLKNRLFS